ncbi:DUF4190 domain-containing protein [Leifsonia sp. NPDC058292]|uniref:DUF4190 domain-containing protein n=1 Tax=Leifsonia sp. NPDC058292 TaxID=3346428 RepID=UPI0036DADC99
MSDQPIPPQQPPVYANGAAPIPPQPFYGYPPAPPVVPGRGLGIAAFVLSFFIVANFFGLILGIVALVQSKRAGHGNGFALAAIIISAVGVALTILVLSLVIPAFVDAAQTCARLGDGVHVIGHATYTCTPTSFNVHTSF